MHLILCFKNILSISTESMYWKIYSGDWEENFLVKYLVLLLLWLDNPNIWFLSCVVVVVPPPPDVSGTLLGAK